MVRKPSMGRQKIEIKRIEQEEARQVTFSKRRAGLFKKASELCILCGAETAIIVFSPAGKAFSFGHPSVESVIDRYLTKNLNSNVNSQFLVDPRRGDGLRALNRQYTEVLNQLEAEKKRGEALQQMRKATKNQAWWEAPIDDLGLHELEQLRVSMEDLKKNVANRANELLIDASVPSFLPVHSIGLVDPFDVKPNISGTSVVPHAYGFGFGFGRGLY